MSDVILTELRSENVIDSLLISGETSHNISIEACYGVDGSFMCKDIEVLYVNA